MKIPRLCSAIALSILCLSQSAMAAPAIGKTPTVLSEFPANIFPPYLQNPTGDGMTICFLTQGTLNVRVVWGEDNANKLAEADATPLVIPGTAWTSWRTRLGKLKPGSRYHYQVKFLNIYDNLERVTPTYHFKTLNPAAESLRFIVFNDIHQQDKTLAALMEHVKPDDYEFALLLGDCLELSSKSGTEAPLLQAWRAYLELLNGSEKPVIFIRGNHDIRGQFASRLAYLFDLPNLSPMQGWGEDHWQFTLRAGPVWFVAMDTGEDTSSVSRDPRVTYKHPPFWNEVREKEATWLQKVVNSKEGMDCPWRIFLSHIPLYNTAPWWTHSGRQDWEPVLKQTRISLMLAGHDHQWRNLAPDKSRPWPVLIGGGPAMQQGTVMVAMATKDNLTVNLLNTQGKQLTSYKAQKDQAGTE